MFKGRKGKALAVEMGGNKVRTFIPGAQVPAAAASQTATPQRPKHDMDAIKVIYMYMHYSHRRLCCDPQ